MRICMPTEAFLCFRRLRSLHRDKFVLAIAVGVIVTNCRAGKGNGRFLQILRQRLLSVVVPVDNLSTQVSASPQAKNHGETAIVSRTAEIHHDQASDDSEDGNRDGEPVRQPELVVGVLVDWRDGGKGDLRLRRLVR
jgi:hypothetical protein